MDEHPVYLPVQPDRRRSAARALALFLFVALILLSGWLGWQLWQAKDQSNQRAAANTQLQKKVDKLTKDLAAAKGSSSSAKSNPVASGNSKACTPVAITQTLKDNLAAAVNSGNYAALQGYMAAAVNVVIAASEKGGDETPAQAVSDMAYLNNGTAPWDFALPRATTDIWAAHFYKQYFADPFFAGKSSNDVVVSFQFDACGKIKTVFMALDSRTLEQ